MREKNAFTYALVLGKGTVLRMFVLEMDLVLRELEIASVFDGFPEFSLFPLNAVNL